MDPAIAAAIIGAVALIVAALIALLRELKNRKTSDKSTQSLIQRATLDDVEKFDPKVERLKKLLGMMLPFFVLTLNVYLLLVIFYLLPTASSPPGAVVGGLAVQFTAAAALVWVIVRWQKGR